MDYSLKRRLVGAAVLVALAVLIVPMLVDGPGPSQTPAERIPLDIPDPPKGPQQTRDIPLDLPATPPRAETAPANPDAVATVDLGTDQSPPAAPAPAGPAEPAASVPSPPTPVAAEASDGKDTRPQPEQPAPPMPAPAQEGRFIVNLGTFSDAANADALEARLRPTSLPLIKETIDLNGKPARRLRAGPFASRPHAEAALVRINQAVPGEKFAVLELEEAAPLAAAQRPAVSAAFAVQLGALKDEREALALRDRVRGAGFAAYVEKTQTDAGVLWRVRAGPELDRARADRMRERIKQSLGLDGIVVGHP